MTIRVGINGLGRIGRCVLRAIYETGAKDIELVAVNASDIDTRVHLLQYDSVHGKFSKEVKPDGDKLVIDGKPIKMFYYKSPKEIPWQDCKVDIVLECTGKFNKASDAAQHNAKKTLLSAPGDGADATIVYGVNNAALKKDHKVVSIGSCTTNALAPLVKVLNDAVGIEAGFMTTIHAYTNDQNLVDNSHKDLRRARAAGLSMIPTSTGAARAIGLVLPELAGKLDGVAIRVPTPLVSLVDLTFTAKRDIGKNDVNNALQAAANGFLQNILAINRVPLVSIDFVHNPASSIVDIEETYVTGNRLCRVASWYDNEWGFSCRMLDVARLWASL